MKRLALALLIGLLPLASQAETLAARPNILLITVDNLGYGDVGCYGNQQVLTPNIDQLAADGVRCTSFYTGAPSCSPSRACLLTGRYPLRNGLNYQMKTGQKLGLSEKEKLIPHYLKQVGYATAAFGKWNIGFAEGTRPLERGFDEFFGHESGNLDYYTHVYNDQLDTYRGNEKVAASGYAPDLWANEAIDFIDRHQREPWFVYLPFNSPHYPNAKSKAPGQPNIWQAPPEAFAAYGLKPDEPDPKKRYHAVITATDSAIGRVLTQLEHLKLSANTLVMWYSDNGAFMLKDRGLEVASNAPFRSGGVTVWEGGIRVPAIVRWPDRIEASSLCREPVVSMDLFMLCLQAAGARQPTDRKIDGLNPIKVLQGRAISPHEQLCWVWSKASAIRRGHHKAVQPTTNAPWELYDLSADPGETNNLADQQTALVESLARYLGDWKGSVTEW